VDFRADLHTHSTASDGTLSPGELVAAAREKGLGAVALTDHDTLAGIGEAVEAGRELRVTVIPGLELSTEAAAEEVHVLGYFLTPQAEELQRRLAELRRQRLTRARRMLERLRALGLPLSWEAVAAEAGTGAVGRPHIARALVAAGYVESVEEAFARYLDRGRPAYVPRAKLTPAGAIDLVQRSGGVAVLAHPGLLSGAGLLEELLELNWQGIEVFYPEHSKEVEEKLYALARMHSLVPTGGSDFHGAGKAQLGACSVGGEVLAELKRRRRF
jgi:hypothetical protein